MTTNDIEAINLRHIYQLPDCTNCRHWNACADAAQGDVCDLWENAVDVAGKLRSELQAALDRIALLEAELEKYRSDL